jgi:hypothetical protein
MPNPQFSRSTRGFGIHSNGGATGGAGGRWAQRGAGGGAEAGK